MSFLRKPGVPARSFPGCAVRGLTSKKSRALAPLKRSTRQYFRLEKVSGNRIVLTKLLQAMKRRIQAIRTRADQMKSHPSLYVEIDLPSWTVGRASYTSEAIEICGARNIFADVDKPALQASKETIIERNPDVILAFDSTPEEFRRRPGWQKISAIQKGWVIGDVGRNMLSHGNHRLVDGMEQLQNRLLELHGE